jgi:hypothetical protein
MVRRFPELLILITRTDVRPELNKVAATYDPVVDACIIQHTHRGLVNVIGVLVADVVLLVTMLIGLLRHANKNSTGIWNLLYQQV